VVAAGLLVLFVAYQQWGTAQAHWQGQRDLRARFAHALAEAHGHVADRTAPAYPAVGNPVGILVIPRLGLDEVVVEGVAGAQLAVGPGHYPGTPLPGQRGNSAIAGHRTTHGAPFNGLAELQPGDPVEVTTLQGRFTYRVTRSTVVSPDAAAVLGATAASQLTLTTCTPKYSAAQRLIVVARLVDSPASSTPIPVDSSAGATDASDPVRSPGTWLLLAGTVLALVGLVVGVGAVRRRTTSRRLARAAPWLAVPVGAVLLYAAFATLDTVLPPTF
jgi:sortase A